MSTTELDDTSAQTLMAEGAHALHTKVTTKLEAALGRAMPQMELRVKHLSIEADVVVGRHEDGRELPTLAHTVKKAALQLSAKKHVVHKTILRDISGVFKPGTVTLILGQPGSGKSALMKVLSGRFPQGKGVTVEGDVTYNGVPQRDIRHRLPQFVAYVDQHDTHFPTLTVKETLQFAHTFCGGELSRRGEELLVNGSLDDNLEALKAARAMFEHYPDIIIEQLGLQNCQDTILGNAMLRGISGGERKRVTTGEMEFGMKYATLMDEISTGLDSAAAFDIVTTQRSIAKTFRKTVVMSLLQPSPEIFALFDNLLILNAGEVMYHGPRDHALSYFENLGFQCPPHRDAADFLMDLGTNQQVKYQSALPSHLRKHPRSPAEFGEHFQASEFHRDTLAALDDPHSADLVASVQDHMNPTPEFHQSFMESTSTLARRQLMVTMRNLAFIRGRGFMVILLGLLYGSMFYQLNTTNVQVVMGVLFQGVFFLGLGQYAQVPIYCSTRAIFFRSSSYVLACSIAQIPWAVGETMVFGSIVYWMCGFVPTAEAFVVFELLILLTIMAFAAWFFFMAAVAPDLHIAKPVSMVSIFTFVAFAGFVVPKNQIPDYFIWIYWIDPIAWCLRAVAVSQYRSADFDVCVYKDIDYCKEYHMKMGEYALSLYDIPSSKSWVGLGVVFLLATWVGFMVLSWLVLEYKRYESPEHTTVSVESTATADVYTLASTPTNATKNPASDAFGGVDEAVVLDVKSASKKFVPVTIAFQDLWYSVPSPHDPKESLDLLKGISGYALPGSITALMGSSGAGKTTLMDVIAGRKTGGTTKGKIMLNGYEANDLAIRRCTGYCEQMDIHSDASTIREALVFSAFLRQDSSVPDGKKYDSVNECLELLDLQDVADEIVRGSPMERMKRLTIGVELAADPSVLFLDEPTSGLDARSAKLIMDGVRKVADTGRTIVCTIHQPSTEVFLLFDKLLLLKRGGETVYFGDLGERGRTMVDYFESIPGVPSLPGRYNPATWMLECIGAGVSHVHDNPMDFVQFFNSSAWKRDMDILMATEGITKPASGVSELVFTRKRAATSFTQLKALVSRFTRLYWRTPSSNLTRLAISPTLGLLFGLVYVGTDYTSYQGMNAGVGMLFLTSYFNCVVAFNSALPITAEDRQAFYRERGSQTYSVLWYFVGSTMAEIPYVFVSMLLFTLVFFPMVGFTGIGTAALFWLHTSLMVLLQTYLSQLLMYCLPSVEMAVLVGVTIFSINVLFYGFNPPANAIPTGYQWLYTVTPQRYSMVILAALVFGDCDELPTYDAELKQYVNVGSNLGCQPMANPPVTIDHITIKEYVESTFEYKHDEIWRNFGVVIAFIVLFRALALLSLRFVNHQKR